MDFWNVSEMDYFNCRDPFDGKEPSFSRGLAILGARFRVGWHEQIMRALALHPRGQGSRRLRPTWSRPFASPGARAFVGSARLGRASSSHSVGARAFGGFRAGLVVPLLPLRLLRDRPGAGAGNAKHKAKARAAWTSGT